MITVDTLASLVVVVGFAGTLAHAAELLPSKVSFKKHGGMYFWRVGCIGGSFYITNK